MNTQNIHLDTTDFELNTEINSNNNNYESYLGMLIQTKHGSAVFINAIKNYSIIF